MKAGLITTVKWSAMIAAMLALPVGASARDSARTPVVDALTRCLENRYGDVISPTAVIPPGLTDGEEVRAAPIADATRAFLFEGTRAGVVSCGVGIYGNVPDAIVRALIGQITALRPEWLLSEHRSGTRREIDWSTSPSGRGVAGVMMLIGPPGRARPTIEARSYSVLVR